MRIDHPTISTEGMRLNQLELREAAERGRIHSAAGSRARSATARLGGAIAAVFRSSSADGGGRARSGPGVSLGHGASG